MYPPLHWLTHPPEIQTIEGGIIPCQIVQGEIDNCARTLCALSWLSYKNQYKKEQTFLVFRVIFSVNIPKITLKHSAGDELNILPHQHPIVRRFRIQFTLKSCLLFCLVLPWVFLVFTGIKLTTRHLPNA